jgi:hypothetical protein
MIFYADLGYKGLATRVLTIEANNDECVDIYPKLCVLF